MKNLFLLDGTTGPVKADIISCIETQSQPDCSIVKKFTTRDFQRYENTPTWPLDLRHQSKKELGEANYDYSYRYLGHLYGFHRSQIDEALDESDNVFIVIRNLNLSRTIRNDYSFVNVVSVLLYADREGLKERLKSEGLNEADINTIIQRNDSTLAGYRANPDSYDEFIITNCILQDMQRHFDRLIGKYESKLRLQRNLVFVLMSFDKSQPRLDDYYAAMQRAVSKVSRGQWVCKSLKDFSKNKPIYDTVKKNIASCRFVIADLTQNRPNVFYELGYAHGFNKVCIITMEKGSERFYYPMLFINIEYENAQNLESQLCREIQLLQEERRI